MFSSTALFCFLVTLADQLSSWKDRIPFVLLFNIATSIELFEEKLSQSTIKLLKGTRFDLAEVDFDVLFTAAMRHVGPSSVVLGPGLSNTILKRHRETLQSNNDFIRTLKVWSPHEKTPLSTC